MLAVGVLTLDYGHLPWYRVVNALAGPTVHLVLGMLGVIWAGSNDGLVWVTDKDGREIGILKALERADGNVTQTARLLNLQRTTLIEKINKYELRSVSTLVAA